MVVYTSLGRCVFSPGVSLASSIVAVKDEGTFANKHELLQYSVRTINSSKVSRITYPRKIHAF